MFKLNYDYKTVTDESFWYMLANTNAKKMKFHYHHPQGVNQKHRILFNELLRLSKLNIINSGCLISNESYWLKEIIKNAQHNVARVGRNKMWYIEETERDIEKMLDFLKDVYAGKLVSGVTKLYTEVRKWKEFFEQINKENPENFVALSDKEYYTEQILNLSDCTREYASLIATTFNV